MATVHQTLAVLFPGAEKRDIAVASAKYSLEVEAEELYSEQKDYEKYFKPSWHIFHKEDVKLLFVHADGSAELVENATGLQQVLSNRYMAVAQAS